MDNYYQFLLSQIGNCPDNPLLRYLFDVDFIWTVFLDKNRAQDGIDLRCLYANLNRLDKDIFADKPCSMLEMLVAFANRIENDFMGCVNENNAPRWFYEMLQSLGIADDMKEFDRARVDHALVRFFNHQRSLFQVPGIDISHLGIWEQLNCWLKYVDERGGF